MKRALLGLGIALVALGAVLVTNTLRLPPPEAPRPGGALVPIDAAVIAQRLAAALRIPTISREAPAGSDPAALHAFAQLLENAFPRLHRALERERVNEHSLLYAWPGSDLSAPPILLAAHMDVVPVEPGTEQRWRHPPFDGVIADNYVWGRGAMDDKSSLMAQMEAIDYLVANGFHPRRTVYFAYGHDEEIGGERGAKAIAQLLASRGVRLEFTLDEGGAITQGIVPGVERPVASVMAGEKGYVSMRLTIRGEGGHSSTPPPRTVVGRLARAVARLEEQPMPARIIAPVGEMLDALAPHMPFGVRMAIANRWLLEPLLLRQLSAGRTTNAMIRTTTAPTIVHGGVKDNVLATEAWAVINFRLLPGDTVDDLERHIREVVDDAGLTLAREDQFGSAPPPVSDTQTRAFEAIGAAVRDVFPRALVASGVILATTDNRHYAPIRDNAYYFMPFLYTPDDEGRIHGIDERIGVAAYADMVRFYVRLIERAAG